MHESHRLRLIATIAAVMCNTVSAESTIYKCDKADGSVAFSSTPCGKNAKQLDKSAAPRTGTSPNSQGVSDREAMSRTDTERQAAIPVITGNQTPAWAAAQRNAVPPQLAGPKVGMSAAEASDGLREWCGAHPKVNRTTDASGTHEQWVCWDDRRYLYFDDGLLTSFQD